MSRVKIVGTIGPVTRTADALAALIAAGLNVVRLNGAHADQAWHEEAIRLVREVSNDLPILLDIPGRKVRFGRLKADVAVERGDTVVLTTSRAETSKIPVTYALLHEDLSPGDLVLANDATLRLTVVSVAGQDVVCRAENAGAILSGKGLNVPGIRLRTEAVSEVDRTLLSFAREQEVDFVGISFAESAEHVEAARQVLGESGPRIVAKIESEAAFDRLAEIAEAADGLMIDRGDLSIEAGYETLTIRQKRVIDEGRRAAKPVIVATEMLHSMIEGSVPLKAEISDISNAVLEGASALMLSAETAVGAHPVEAVALMRRVADTMTDHFQELADTEDDRGGAAIPRAIEDAVVLVTRRLPVTKIVAVTRSGFAARMLAARRPRPPIIAVSDDAASARAMNLLPGTTGVHVPIPFERTSTDHIPQCLEELWRRHYLEDEDLVLVTSLAYPAAGNRMNLIETHHVRDLRAALGWR